MTTTARHVGQASSLPVTRASLPAVAANRHDAKSQLPEGWRWVRLGDACKQDRKIVEPNSKLAATLPYLSLEHVESTTGKILKEPHQSVEDEGKSTTFAFDSCHVLYGKLRPYLNKVALPEFAGRCTTEIIPLQPSEGVYREFLCWLLRRSQTVDAAMQGKTGSRMPRADMDELMKLEVPLPPLAEQQRIAGILKEQMAAVERVRRSAGAQLQAAELLPAAYLRAVFNNGEAQSWPKKRLGEVLELRQEVVHPYEKPSGAATFVGLEHIQSVTGVRTGSIALEMSELTGRKPRFYRGDIVYGYLRPYLNKVWLAEFDGLCSVDQYVFKVDATKADATFVWSFMRSPVYLQRAPIGLIQSQLPRIRTEEVASVELNLPSLADQRRIAAQLSSQMASAERLCQTLAEQLDAINQLPAALLRRAFHGEL